VGFLDFEKLLVKIVKNSNSGFTDFNTTPNRLVVFNWIRNKRLSGQLVYFLQEEELILLDIYQFFGVP